MKVVKKPRGRQHKTSTRSDGTVAPMQILWQDTHAEAVSTNMARCVWAVAKPDTSKRCAKAEEIGK